jgi:hypothetical protein
MHILECTVSHLCHFNELNLFYPIDNDASRRTYSPHSCSVSVAHGSVTKTIKKKHTQINYSLLTNSTRDLAYSIVSHGCESIVSIYYSWIFFCRIHGKKQEQNNFTYILITGMNYETILFTLICFVNLKFSLTLGTWS